MDLIKKQGYPFGREGIQPVIGEIFRLTRLFLDKYSGQPENLPVTEKQTRPEQPF